MRAPATLWPTPAAAARSCGCCATTRAAGSTSAWAAAGPPKATTEVAGAPIPQDGLSSGTRSTVAAASQGELSVHDRCSAMSRPLPTAPEHDRVLILDFGSQFTQLIARRVRESGVYCEILPATAEPAPHRGVRAARHHPLRRPGQRHRRDQPAHAGRACSVRPAGAGHLLRPAGDVRPARRRGQPQRPSGVRPRLGRRDRGLRAVPRRLGEGRARAGLDEPRRPGDPAAAGLPHGRPSARARRSPPSPTMPGIITACSSTPRCVHTPHGAAVAAQLHPPRRRAAPAAGPWRASATPRSRASARRSGRAG